MRRFVPAERVLTAGLYPFVAGDVLKSLLAASALPLCWTALARLPGRRSF